MEIVMADLERTNERAANAERQVERLKQQLSLATESLQQQAQEDTYQQNSSSDQAMDMLKRSALEVELATKEKEIAQLVEDVQRLQASLNKLRETTSAQVARLEEELSAKNKAFRFLENKLRTQEDYEEVKRELRVLKSIEFANVYQEGGHVEEGKSLEVLLLEKNKSLQTENTHLKVVNASLTDYGAGSTATPKFTTTTTSSSTTKKSDRSPSLTPSSSLSPVLPSSMSSLSFASAMAISASAPPVFTRHLSMPSSRTYMSEVTTSRSISSEATTSFPMLPSSAAAIKQEFSSPVCSAPCALPISFASDMDNILHPRTPCILSSGRQSPANCKLSPDSLISPHSASTNSGRPLSPITSLPSLLDPRHFAPPLSPFYAFPGGPFHSAFMPLNMVKSEISSTSGVLDTGYVAKTVRELLSIHNIGQRLFAKHVLGLSQGTVSELLSKPKSWDKLTEKGRESYRKMHAWATDDANIMALKAISPKKGIHPITSNNSYKEKEDLATEERIANILSEAQVAMHMKKTLEQQQVANAVVSSIYHHEMSKMGGKSPGMPVMSPSGPPMLISNGQHYPSETPRTKSEIETPHSANSSQDEAASAQEMVARIYRQELEKLKKAADSAGNIAASAMYAQELDRLNLAQHSSVSVSSSSCQPPTHPFLPSPSEADCSQSSPLALDCRTSRPSGLKLKTEPPDSTSDETVSQITNCGAIDLSKPCSQTSSTPSSSPSSDSGGHVASAFVLVHSRLNGHDSRISESAQAPPQKQPPGGPPTGPSYGAAVTSESLSPLQKMQNIANSFTSRPNSGLPSSKPLRAVLPPITQEEFDRFANMNTDDLVKKVKETLSQYSISQRLFGESVLGLSQGSVSDLLARPKPWHMLTQKGREPFIRMQLFLEDADSIPKLVASQYRIPPDKLMRSNSRGSTEAAQRRRKSSTEDKNFESPTQPKRPRVFFTEDQKDSLRQAYNQDPYPNQNTIEALAKSLNVGVKTVINWFHNHRMRAKQQHHAAGDAPIKAEPDESSNQSDVSSMSSDVTSGNTQMGQLFHGGIAPADVNQWIFPQFEPMALKRKVPSALDDNEEDNKENNGGLDENEDGDDEMDEPDGFNTTSGSHNNNNNNNIGSAVEGDYSAMKRQDSEDGDSDKVVGEANQKWVRSRDDSLDGAGAAAITSASNSSSSSANRRKRSNPQRIFEGAQIDWAMMGSSDKVPGSSVIREEIVDEGSESVSGARVEPHSLYHNSAKISSCNSHVFHEADNGAAGRFSGRQTCSQSVISYHSAARHNQNEASVHRIRKIEKIKKSISSLGENWDEEEDETVSSIEKIQKHIEAKSNEDWEF